MTLSKQRGALLPLPPTDVVYKHAVDCIEEQAKADGGHVEWVDPGNGHIKITTMKEDGTETTEEHIMYVVTKRATNPRHRATPDFPG